MLAECRVYLQPDDLLISAEKNTEGPTQKREKKKEYQNSTMESLEFTPLTFP